MQLIRFNQNKERKKKRKIKWLIQIILFLMKSSEDR